MGTSISIAVPPLIIWNSWLNSVLSGIKARVFFDSFYENRKEPDLI